MNESKFATSNGLFAVFMGISIFLNMIAWGINSEFKENKATSKEHTILLNTLLKKVDSLEVKIDSLER